MNQTKKTVLCSFAFFSIIFALSFTISKAQEPTIADIPGNDGTESITEVDDNSAIGGDATGESPAEDSSEKGIGIGVPIPGQSEPINSYLDYMKAILNFAKNLGIALTVLMLIFAGYKYMTSQGNPTAIGEAKDITVGAISGFALLFIVYLILNILNISL